MIHQSVPSFSIEKKLGDIHEICVSILSDNQQIWNSLRSMQNDIAMLESKSTNNYQHIENLKGHIRICLEDIERWYYDLPFKSLCEKQFKKVMKPYSDYLKLSKEMDFVVEDEAEEVRDLDEIDREEKRSKKIADKEEEDIDKEIKKKKLAKKQKQKKLEVEEVNSVTSDEFDNVPASKTVDIPPLQPHTPPPAPPVPSVPAPAPKKKRMTKKQKIEEMKKLEQSLDSRYNGSDDV